MNLVRWEVLFCFLLSCLSQNVLAMCVSKGESFEEGKVNIVEPIPAKGLVIILFTENGKLITDKAWIECKNESDSRQNVNVNIPDEIYVGDGKFVKVDDIFQMTIKDGKIYDIALRYITGILQAGAFISEDLMMDLKSFLRKHGYIRKDKQDNQLDIPDFSRFLPPSPSPESTGSVDTASFDDQSSVLAWLRANDYIDDDDLLPGEEPLYFCVPLNKLKDRDISMLESHFGTLYSVVDGGIIEKISGDGPAVDQLQDYYLSDEPCTLNGSGGWTSSAPFSGTVELFSYHRLQLAVRLVRFEAIVDNGNVHLNWLTSSEVGSIGSRLWRVIKNSMGTYELTLLGKLSHVKLVDSESSEDCSIKIQGELEEADPNQEHELISTIDNPMKNTCYSFVDITHLDDKGYLYLLESFDDNGDSTFHCDHIDAVTIGQGLPIDLPSAIDFCKKETGSED